MKTGALGSTGKNIGNFLSDAGLADPSPAQILGEIQGLRQEVAALNTQVNGISAQLDRLGAAVASGFYSTNVALANHIRGAVMTGSQKLQKIAAAPPADRHEMAATSSIYNRNLKDKELTFELYLTGGAPGADGILQLASKRGTSARPPFLTTPMTEFARTVWKDYAMVQAEWLTLTVNVLHYTKAKPERITEAITEANGALDREWRVFPGSSVVFPNTVLDTRTMLLWTWKANVTGARASTTPATGAASTSAPTSTAGAPVLGAVRRAARVRAPDPHQRRLLVGQADRRPAAGPADPGPPARARSG